MTNRLYSPSELAHALFETRADLDRQVKPSVRESLAAECPPFSIEVYKQLASLSSHSGVNPRMDIGWQAYILLEEANDIVDQGAFGDEPPRLPITQAAVRMARAANRVQSYGDLATRACLQAELRLTRSLNNPGRSAPPGARQRQPEVLFDTDGQPFAYQKCSGWNTAYAWRAATVNTAEGEVWLPASCFFEAAHKRLRLGAQLRKVSFLRFSTHLLHPAIAEAGLHHAATYPPTNWQSEPLMTDFPQLHENIAETLQLTPQMIGERACALLNR